MSSHGMASSLGVSSSSRQDQEQAPIVPRRLELSVNPTDGSLLTAPLSQVLLAATDSLYSDLYNMAHGELDVTTAAQQAEDVDATMEEQQESGAVLPTLQQTKRERMSNLSFAQRRHELAWRLASQHAKSLQHVAALTAANASSDFAKAVAVSSRALQHARTAWVQADEAQDALYFFHAQLFPARAPPHDVYGACDIQLEGKWLDLPNDLRLTVDRYETSPESRWSRKEVDERWQLAVRDKLVRGEVGWMLKMNGQIHSVLWKVSLRGGIVKLTHGKPKRLLLAANNNNNNSLQQQQQQKDDHQQQIYPITALLTVMSVVDQHQQNSSSPPPPPPEWKLLSVDVRVQAKTGEFNHQLETSNRQRYDLHRLAALAMSREEARARRRPQEQEQETVTTKQQDNNTTEKCLPSTCSANKQLPPARPLQALFQVAHVFSLSWQLELLSAQAQALRRGVWAAGESNPIQVTPVRFFHNANQHQQKQEDKEEGDDGLLGVVSVSFWKVDDSYGPPSMGDLSIASSDESSQQQQQQHELGDNVEKHGQTHYAATSSQMVLSIRAESQVGMRISMSGAASVMEATRTQPHLCSIAQELIEATSNPFALSISDALLAATRLCAERKCHAVVQALQPPDDNQKSILPDWILLAAERGSVAVAARVQYHGVATATTTTRRGMPILFRLMCDARTGSFVNCFPRQTNLLRQLACNSNEASESMSLRIASLPQNRRRAAATSSSGRVVRDAFDGLIRSMNLLGQRTGVGGSWDDIDDKSLMLRHRSIQSACSDVKVSLMKCCGMAALFGLTPLAIGGGVGLDALPDMAAEAVQSLDGVSFLPTPPLSILLDQQMIETSTATSDGMSRKTCYLKQSLFSVVCAANDDSLILYPLNVGVKLDSPTKVPQRISCVLSQFKAPASDEAVMNGNGDKPPLKRRKHDINGNIDSRSVEDLMIEAGHFATIIAGTIEP